MSTICSGLNLEDVGFYNIWLTKTTNIYNITIVFDKKCQLKFGVIMKLNKFFAEYPVFAYEEFVAYLSREGGYSQKSAWSLLNYHEKSGHILRIRRGFYASVPAAHYQKTYQVDPYLIAGRMTKDSVLGYHTALDINGFAYSVFHYFYFFAHKAIRKFAFQGMQFQALPLPKQLLDKQQENFGVTVINREGLNIRVTGLERTLVDVLNRPEYAGGFVEIWQSYAMVSILNLDKVIEYTLLLNNATLIAKVGFFLEQHREQFKVDEDHLKLLQTKIPVQKHYLERTKRTPGKLVKRWNLIVPEKILNKLWEESNEIF